MEKFAFLESSAFIVIGILGIKLLLSLFQHFQPDGAVGKFLDSRAADITMSSITVAIFFIPIITSVLFNVPKKNEA
jgi:ABC-type phosphate transport system permease subunit